LTLHAARVGGEEFALLTPATSVTQAHLAAESVRKLVKAMKIKRRGTQEVIATLTISGGVAAWVAGDDAGSLLSAADAALYRAKAYGRDRIVVA
jgi:diguanylate cyclase (GGDEF)-like protein